MHDAFLNDIYTSEAAEKYFSDIVGEDMRWLYCSPDPTTNSKTTNTDFSRILGPEYIQNIFSRSLKKDVTSALQCHEETEKTETN